MIAHNNMNEQVSAREHYTRILSSYLILVEDGMNPYLDKIFAALGKICRDDEEAVVKVVTECSGVIGFYANSQMVLASLLPMVRSSARVVSRRRNTRLMVKLCGRWLGDSRAKTLRSTARTG